MLIRKLEQRDFDPVLRMMLVFYQSPAVLCHAPEAVLRKCLNDCLADTPYLEGYVFETETGLAGYGMLAKGYATEAGGMCVHVEDLYILPEYRSQGIGKEFLRYVLEKYRDTAARVRLEVEPENDRASTLYEACGFRVLPYRQMFVDMA